MKKNDAFNFDHVIVGSGLAGLFTALHMAESGTVLVATKRAVDESNTKYAQGGVACVVDDNDSFDAHIKDTTEAGDHMCKPEVVRRIVKNGPGAIQKLISLGAHFTTRGDMGEAKRSDEYHLGREGGHTRRRVLHAGDITGEEIENVLIARCVAHPNITLWEHHIAIDLVTSKRLGWIGDDFCLGIYVLDIKGNQVKTLISNTTTIATGGAGKVYLYSSNPDIACGDGIAMCYRAYVPIVNMEFFQFHPTILHHSNVTSFLISEALRGEGAVLKIRNCSGKYVRFMSRYHEMGDLAPRDVAARAIDNELKKSGRNCVYLDIRSKDAEFLRKRFPNIYEKCMEAGIDMAKDMIPVVPAAHYCCGGIRTDLKGYTGVNGLYAVGECASTGLHGANRLASNSLLESLVVARFAAADAAEKLASLKEERPTGNIPMWHSGNATDSDELVVISHNWDEIRRFMWDYVGIVRTNKRLERAKSRIRNIRKEIEKYYWDFNITPDLIELRNIASVAEIIIDSAMSRKESRGLHHNADYPGRDPKFDYLDTVIKRPSEMV